MHIKTIKRAFGNKTASTQTGGLKNAERQLIQE